MSPLRTLKEKYAYVPANAGTANLDRDEPTPAPVLVVDLTVSDTIFYPATSAQRAAFRTSSGKRITPHQWAVYDFTCRIPCGKVSTYKDVCRAIGEGSPRSVGSALRNNPFAPRVPCHRVVASTLFVGGFCGEWGPTAGSGKQCARKIDMLAREGVRFDARGFLLGGDDALWRGDSS